MRRRAIHLAAVMAVAATAALGFHQPSEGASRRRGEPSVSVQPREDGGFDIEGSGYGAAIAADGNLHSFRVGDVEMLDDRTAISLGAFFYADGPRRLTTITQQDPLTIEATDGKYTARYRFSEGGLKVLLSNATEKPVPYFAVLSPEVGIVHRSSGGEAAAVPANERWGDVRFFAEGGAYLQASGGTRVWGPWLGRQVWEVSDVPPRGGREIHLSAGRGEPPKATLAQLVGLRADLAAEAGVVPAGRPIEMVVSVENRSDKEIRGALSVELSGSEGDMVIYQAAAVDLAPRRVTERTFRWQMSAPDFYTVAVTAAADGREIGTSQASAGYRVEDIRPEVARPKDFDAFWQRLLSEVGSGPREFRMELDGRRSRRNVDVWKVQYRSIDRETIYGWLATPADARSLPAILYLSGYGSRPVEPPVGLASRGWAVLAIDVRGNRVDGGRPRPFEDYCTEGIDSPDTYVYREIVGHALEAVQLLASREEVDPNRVAVVGVSEGGGVGILLGALSPSVRAVAAEAPLLVDFPRSIRAASWPYTEIARYLRQNPGKRDGVGITLGYFDAANFAPQVVCPVLLSIGFLDQVSLPAAVYGLYNVLPGQKEIRSFPKAGHAGGGADRWAYTLNWLETALDQGPKS